MQQRKQRKESFILLCYLCCLLFFLSKFRFSDRASDLSSLGGSSAEMGDCGRHVRRHGEWDERGRGRADQARGKKHFRHGSGEITQQDLSSLVAEMTSKAEQGAQAGRGDELHGLKIEHHFWVFLRTDGRQQLQAQVLRHAFRVNLGGSDGQYQDLILDLALQILKRRLSHGCESASWSSPWKVYWQRPIKAIHDPFFPSSRM